MGLPGIVQLAGRTRCTYLGSYWDALYLDTWVSHLSEQTPLELFAQVGLED
jgi:hypothetical protein